MKSIVGEMLERRHDVLYPAIKRGVLMSGFYVSLIFVGIMLVIVSLVLIFLDKKNIFVFRKNIEETKRELVEIINDAEQMIDELNRFSDYIVTQMDLKSEELNRNIKAAEKKIKDLSSKAYKAMEATVPEQKPAFTVPETAEQESEANIIVAPSAVSTASSAAAAYSKTNVKPEPVRKKDKIIPFSSRYAEVLRLSKEGMKEVDIAKNLNMGKGEVELIIGLRR